jgi:GT2 family glycosyltransferase
MDTNLAREPFVSVIISNYNGQQFLKECLASLEKSVYRRFETIVVDAGSSDGSPEMIRNEFPDVKVVQAGHVGIGTAINIGIKHAKGEIIVFDLNNDDVVHEDWLLNLVSAVCQRNYAVVVCGKRYVYGTSLIDSVGGKIRMVTGSFPPIGSGKPDGPQFEESFEVDYVPVICTSRKVVEKVGLCDEKYEMYFEDTDFCRRAKRQGFKIICVPDAKFSHYGSMTFGKVGRKRIYYILRNRIRFIIKNFPFPFMLVSLALTGWWIASEFTIEYKWINSVSGGKFSFLSKNVGPCFEAVRWNIKHFRETLGARRNTKIIRG